MMNLDSGSNDKVIIVGGGLSGLVLAYVLFKRNIQTSILEASPRLGGRILTVKGRGGTSLELGATWFSNIHTNLLTLLEELGLMKYPQYSKGISLFQTSIADPPQHFSVPESEMTSYRIVGGTQLLTDTLVQKLPKSMFSVNTRVTAIEDVGDHLLIETLSGQKVKAGSAIICVPPQLASKQIKFFPTLHPLLTELLPNVQTWMAGAIKFTLEYGTPFWRTNGYSSMLYSHTGMITEMYDHTNFEEDRFGFTGFLDGNLASYPAQLRRSKVLDQLTALLGPEAASPLDYFDKVWTDEFILGENPMIYRPHQYNGLPLLQHGYFGNKLYFAATETAANFPGYMEGAIIAAQDVAMNF